MTNPFNFNREVHTVKTCLMSMFAITTMCVTLANKPLIKGGEEFNSRSRTIDAIYSMRVHNFDATRIHFNPSLTSQ